MASIFGSGITGTKNNIAILMSVLVLHALVFSGYQMTQWAAKTSPLVYLAISHDGISARDDRVFAGPIYEELFRCTLGLGGHITVSAIEPALKAPPLPRLMVTQILCAPEAPTGADSEALSEQGASEVIPLNCVKNSDEELPVSHPKSELQ